MAQYQTQQGPDPRYGPTDAQQRGHEAFSSIFGGPPAGARSHTMTSQSVQPDFSRSAPPSSDAAFPRRPVPERGPSERYSIQQPPPQQTSAHVAAQYQRLPPQIVSQPNNYSPQRHPQPQYFPQPLRPDRRPHGAPQYVDPRSPPYPDARPDPRLSAPTQQNPTYDRRPYAPSGPALNTDSYRSQSMAALPRPQYQGPGAANVSGGPANLRRLPYANNHLAHTTAHGRMIPDRSSDERTMSMSSYSSGIEQPQTMSGRVVPNRRYPEPSSTEPLSDQASPQSVRANSMGDSMRARVPSQGSIQSRTFSMASTITSPHLGYDDSLSPQPSVNTAQTSRSTNSRASQPNSSTMVAQVRQSRVYGALLSKVADSFQTISVGEKVKDGLVFQNAFTGYEAVEQIRSIIRTSDRNLALLLGRSLDAQKYFHEVSYAHRLRDSPSEIYQFKESRIEEVPEVNGVFTLLTECYSPTCTRDHLCYSIACPRRLEQQSRLNLKLQPGLRRENSQSSLHEEKSDDQKLWQDTVSPDVWKSVDKMEAARQEIIAELMYTERDFVKDLEYLRDFWINPLYAADRSPIGEHRRYKFIRLVFSNCQEVHAVNARLSAALTRRQQQQPIVSRVGDIFLDYVTQFQPFIKYGANQLFGKHEFEKEKASNPAFQKFVEHTERLKESRRLEVNGYLTKPTTRLARYPLLLKAICDKTKPDNPDKKDLPKVIELVKAVLDQVNTESGKAENLYQLMLLNQSLKWGSIPQMDLKLTEDSRQLIQKVPYLKKTATAEVADITAYLFDHAVLLVRTKTVNKREEQKVFRKPILLELLDIPEMEDIVPKGMTKRPSASTIPNARTVSSSVAKDLSYPMTFKAFGKGGYEVTLYSTKAARETFLENVHKQKEKLKERVNIFVKTEICRGFFKGDIRVNCAVPIDSNTKLAVGTNQGVFIVDRKPRDPANRPRRLFDLKLVTQIAFMQRQNMLLVLADKALWSFALSDDVYQENSVVATKRGRKICHASYFNAGTCDGKDLVCCVKSSSLSSTIKVYEPIDSSTQGKKKSGLAKRLAGGQDVLRPFKEFYIPMESNSIHFLKTKLCVAGTKGFEIISLETLETQSLLNNADTSLDPFIKRGLNTKPIFIKHKRSEFLLCYAEFAFFVNKHGWRDRGSWQISWEGTPNAFALWGEDYILAFDPDFIEIRRYQTGGLISLEMNKNTRYLHCLNEKGSDVLYAYEDENGEDVIASLDFWVKGRPGPGVQAQASGPLTLRQPGHVEDLDGSTLHGNDFDAQLVSGQA